MRRDTRDQPRDGARQRAGQGARNGEQDARHRGRLGEREGPAEATAKTGATSGTAGSNGAHAAPVWDALLVAGCSGVGKSRVARRIARRSGASVLQIDDIRLALQRVTTPEEQPALHYFLCERDVWQHETEVAVQGYIGVAEALAPAIEIILAHHLSAPRPDRLVIEGDSILPRLATLASIPGGAHDGSSVTTAGRVRGVVLYEADPVAILANLRARGRGIAAYTPAEQEAQARASWRYGLWLRDEAIRLRVPTVPARPYASLVPRVLAAVMQAG